MKGEVPRAPLLKGIRLVLIGINVIVYFAYVNFPALLHGFLGESTPTFMLWFSGGLLGLYLVDLIICLKLDPKFLQTTLGLWEAILLVISGVLLPFGPEYLGPQCFRAVHLLEFIKYLPFVGETVTMALSVIESAIPMARQSLAFMVFFLALFSLMGMEFFTSSLSRRCLHKSTGEPPVNAKFCKFNGTAPWIVLGPAAYCEAPYVCEPGTGNPHFNITSFDNFPSAMLTLFQTATLYDWSTYMYALQEAEYLYATMLFFFGAIIVLNWVMINLFIAVLASAYQGTVDTSATDKSTVIEQEKDTRHEAHALGGLAEESLQQLVECNQEARRGGDTAFGQHPLSTSGVRKLRALLMGPPDACNPRPVLLTSAPSGHEDAPPPGPRYSIAESRLSVPGDVTPKFATRIRDAAALRRFTAVSASSRGSVPRPDGHAAVGPPTHLPSPRARVSHLPVLPGRQSVSRPRAAAPWRHRIYYFLNGEGYEVLDTSVATVNTVIIACEFVGQPDAYGTALMTAEVCCASFFLGIAAAELLCMPSPRVWASRQSNVVDFVTVLLSLPSAVGDVLFRQSYVFPTFAFLRVFRMWRVVRLGARFRELNRIGLCFRNTLTPICALFVIILAVVTVYSVVGGMLFAGRFRDWPEYAYPRLNFDSFPKGVLTLYIILTGDTWAEPMYAAMSRVHWLAVGYFLSFYLLVTIVMLSLTVSIFVHNFLLSERDIERLARVHDSPAAKAWLAAKTGEWRHDAQSRYQRLVEMLPRTKIAEAGGQRLANSNLFLFPTAGRGVAVAKAIVESRAMGYFIVVAIIASTFHMTEDPPNEAVFAQVAEPPLWHQIGDWVFIAIFSAELALKLVAYGALGYWRDPWNRLDALVVLTSVLAEALAGTPFLRIIRLGRALRPLRFVHHSETLRVVLFALVESLSVVGQLFLLLSCIYALFALVGMSAFLGRFSHCTRADAAGRLDCAGVTATAGGARPAAWLTPHRNFDIFPNSFLTLLEVGSLSDWAVVMFMGMDVTAPGLQPRLNASWAHALFFVAFTALGGICFVNLFIAVISEHVNLQRGAYFMSEAQKSWVEFRRQMLLLRPKVIVPSTTSPVRRGFQRVALSRPFRWAVWWCIVLNVGVFVLQWEGQPERMGAALRYCNWAFAGGFCVELVVKVAAYHPFYFRDRWNVFDCVVTTGSFVTMVLEILSVDHPLVLFVGKGVRIARICRLVTTGPVLKALFSTLLISAPSIINILLLLVMILLLYGYVGKTQFANLKYQAVYNGHVNFRRFAVSLGMLMQCVTLDNWNGVMWDAALAAPGCTANAVMNDCGYPVAARVYFYSFYLLVTFIIYNLVIAIVMDNFGMGLELRLGSKDDLEQFRDVWLYFDAHQTGRIRRFDLPSLLLTLNKLGSAYGFDPNRSQETLQVRLVLECRRCRGGRPPPPSPAHVAGTGRAAAQRTLLWVEDRPPTARPHCTPPPSHTARPPPPPPLHPPPTHTPHPPTPPTRTLHAPPSHQPIPGPRHYAPPPPPVRVLSADVSRHPLRPPQGQPRALGGAAGDAVPAPGPRAGAVPVPGRHPDPHRVYHPFGCPGGHRTDRPPPRRGPPLPPLGHRLRPPRPPRPRRPRRAGAPGARGGPASGRGPVR